MVEKGTFQISRNIFESEIWTKPPEWLKIWLHILGKVNFKENNLFERGENFFNYQVIASECRVKYKSVENCVKFLKEREQIGVRKTSRGVILKVTNYDKYQANIKNTGNKKGIEREQIGNKQGTIKEEGNNEIMKEGNNININSKELIKKENKKDFKDWFLEEIGNNFSIIEEIKRKTGVNESFIRSSAEDFILYWTEKAPNGKKERWDMQKTFDIKRRFYTWIKKGSQNAYSVKKERKSSNIGILF